MRGEVAARAGVHRHVERHRHRERPHRVGLRLLLEGHREHPLVHARLHERRRRRSRSSRRPSRRCARGSAACPRRRATSARNSSGIITPSNRSGALPTTTASMSSKPTFGVGQRAVDRLAAQARRSRRPRAWPGGGSGPRRSRRPAAWPSGPSFHHAHEVLLEGRPAGRVAEHLGRCRRTRPVCAASPMRIRPPVNIGLPDSGAAGRVDRDVVAQAELGAQDQLLVAERRVQLGHLDAVEVGGRARRWPGRGGAGQVAGAHADRVDVRREAGDPGRSLGRPRAPGRRRRARSPRRRR